VPSGRSLKLTDAFDGNSPYLAGGGPGGPDG